MKKQTTLDSILDRVKGNLAGRIQVRFTGLIKTGKKATYDRSEAMLKELAENSKGYRLDSSIDHYDRDDLFFKPISFLEKGQFEKLSKMYDVLPEAVPMPITKVREGSGKEIGYIMKKVEGYTMSSYLAVLDNDQRYKENERILQELNGYVEKLSANGIGHGDIHGKNVIIQNGKPFLIDPFAINDYDGWYTRRDLKTLQKLRCMGYEDSQKSYI